MAQSSELELTRNYQALCLVIGHLFITFARLEGCLAAMLKLHLANAMGNMLDKEKVALSSAIYGGMRFGAARDAIKRIAAVEKCPADLLDFALSLFAHVGHIQDLRDKIAHQQLVPAYKGADAYWQLVDAITTRDIRNPKVYVFDMESVAAAAQDLNTAAHRLGNVAKAGHILCGLEGAIEPIAWQYKPSMLKLVPQSTLRSPL